MRGLDLCIHRSSRNRFAADGLPEPPASHDCCDATGVLTMPARLAKIARKFPVNLTWTRSCDEKMTVGGHGCAAMKSKYLLDPPGDGRFLVRFKMRVRGSVAGALGRQEQ